MNWTRSTILITIAAGVLATTAAGTAAAVAVTGHYHARVAATAPATQPPATQPPATQAPAAPAPAPAMPSAQPSPSYPQSDGQDPANVVINYYDAINRRDFTTAWNLGGSNLAAQNGQTYDSWAAGYIGTAQDSVNVYDDGSAGPGKVVVHCDLTALQSGGDSKYYSGTYTVENSVIVSAHMIQTGGSSS